MYSEGMNANMVYLDTLDDDTQINVKMNYYRYMLLLVIFLFLLVLLAKVASVSSGQSGGGMYGSQLNDCLLLIAILVIGLSLGNLFM
jgi:NADH:ubiquinone oxidoreductase subunit 3 (subunit A)